MRVDVRAPRFGAGGTSVVLAAVLVTGGRWLPLTRRGPWREAVGAPPAERSGAGDSRARHCGRKVPPPGLGGLAGAPIAAWRPDQA
jgi:hypothetical protein